MTATPSERYTASLADRLRVASAFTSAPAGVDGCHAAIEATLTVLAGLVGQLKPPVVDREAFASDLARRILAKLRVAP